LLLSKNKNKKTDKQKHTPWILVRNQNIPTERPPLVRGIVLPTSAARGVSRGQRGATLTAINLSFLDQSRYFFFKAVQLSSRG
jgi:hypothetical protein